MTTPTPPQGPFFQQCSECGSPLDREQRYCVNCAARRMDVSNPSTVYFASASARRSRRAAAGSKPAAASPGSRIASVAFLALLPVAVAVGVLVGRDNNDGDNDALLKALRSGQTVAAGPAVTATGGNEGGTSAETAGDGGGAAAATPVADQVVESKFALKKGYTVLLSTVPITASAADVAQAEADAQAKGAKDVGMLDPSKFKITPDQGKDYLIYSGAFTQRSQADAALKKLQGKFPKATVIGVKDLTDETGAVVLAQTDHGELHQVTNFDPPPEVIQHDTELVQDLASQTGGDYTDLQETLPDVVVVGGDPDDAPPLPTGGGD